TGSPARVACAHTPQVSNTVRLHPDVRVRRVGARSVGQFRVERIAQRTCATDRVRVHLARRAAARNAPPNDVPGTPLGARGGTCLLRMAPVEFNVDRRVGCWRGLGRRLAPLVGPRYLAAGCGVSPAARSRSLAPRQPIHTQARSWSPVTVV